MYWVSSYVKILPYNMCKTQQMYEKTVSHTSYRLKVCPYKYKIQEMCEKKAVNTYNLALRFAPD